MLKKRYLGFPIVTLGFYLLMVSIMSDWPMTTSAFNQNTKLKLKSVSLESSFAQTHVTDINQGDEDLDLNYLSTLAIKQTTVLVNMAPIDVVRKYDLNLLQEENERLVINHHTKQIIEGILQQAGVGQVILSNDKINESASKVLSEAAANEFASITLQFAHYRNRIAEIDAERNQMGLSEDQVQWNTSLAEELRDEYFGFENAQALFGTTREAHRLMNQFREEFDGAENKLSASEMDRMKTSYEALLENL